MQPQNQTVSYLLPRLANHFNCNIVIFSLTQINEFYSKFPVKTDFTLPRIFIALDAENMHCKLINDSLKFFNHYRFICLDCEKHVKHFKHKHSCSKRKKCRLCHKMLLNPGEYIDTDILRLYCDSLLGNDNLNLVCELCNSPFKTLNCKKGHTNSICKGVRFCSNCQKTIEAEPYHNCDHVKCRHCHETFSKFENHQCNLAIFKRPQCLESLVFASFFPIIHPSSCISCINNDICFLHLGEQVPFVEPNAGILVAEVDERFNFESVLFTSKFLDISGSFNFKFNYKPPDIKEYERRGKFRTESLIDKKYYKKSN